MTHKIKYDRQIPFVGKNGQSKIQNIKVAIIGISGTGSHVVQQLAYLGVKNFTLIDMDKVSKTNLNRLIGANEEDIGEYKVDIGKRLINFIARDALVNILQNTFINKVGFKVLKNTDVIFGCVDKDGARHILNEFCKAYKKSYIDIATEIDPISKEYGGRIVICDSEAGCLHCRDVLTTEEIRRDFSSPEERTIDDRIYGVDKKYLGSSGPAVVSLNGVLASIAITEFILYITSPNRTVKKCIKYSSSIGTTFPNLSDIDCYYCKKIYGIGDKVDIDKYIRNGIDKILT